MDAINTWLGDWGGNLWTYIVLPVVIVLGVYFTLRSGVVQFRMIPEMFRTLTDKAPVDSEGKPQSVSAFQAFTISAASRVGVGNIAGVGTAIAAGGPGAVFWMWLMAFIGGASSFIESTLGQLFKVRDGREFRGGPAYYIQHGLKARWGGILFAVILIVCFPFAFSMLQGNTIAASIEGIAGEASPTWLPWVIAVVIAGLTGLVVFGGVHRIAKVTEAMVPAMAGIYLIVGIIIVAMHIELVPQVLGRIFVEAFSPQAVVGGGLGTVIMNGVKRGMFSNEAGLGSAPNAGASAAVTHPVKQGLVQTLGVYFDTFLVCSITAFIILVGNPDLSNAEQGIGLTQAALVGNLGQWTTVLLSVIIFLLAFSSIIGNYYYGYSNIEFITKSPVVLRSYQALVVVAIFIGCVANASIIWNAADGIMGLMALVNLVSIALLSGLAMKLLKDYLHQRRQGHDPVFTRDMLPEADGIQAWEDLESVVGPLSVEAHARADAKHADHFHHNS